jgi:peptidoglycan/xylan/chitin deacetylase (PgdA/CDA1 family)
LRKTLKTAWGNCFFYGGLFHVIRFFNNVFKRKRLTILAYHRVGDDHPDQNGSSLPFLIVSKAIFEEQLKFLKKWYKIIGFEDLYQNQDKDRMPKNALIITFDDGYEDNYFNAYPILKKYDLKAVFFIAANKMENQNNVPYWWDRAYYYLNRINIDVETEDTPSNSNEVISLFKIYSNNRSALFQKLNGLNTEEIEKCLDDMGEKYGVDQTEIVVKNRRLRWEQIRTMGTEMEIGSHSCNHCNLVGIERARKIYEIKQSARIIENNCGKRVLAFSYPGGKRDEETEEMVEDAGYKFAVTTRPGVNDLKNPLVLKRINIWEETSLTEKGKFSKGYFSFKMMGF